MPQSKTQPSKTRSSRSQAARRREAVKRRPLTIEQAAKLQEQMASLLDAAASHAIDAARSAKLAAGAGSGAADSIEAVPGEAENVYYEPKPDDRSRPIHERLEGIDRQTNILLKTIDALAERLIHVLPESETTDTPPHMIAGPISAGSPIACRLAGISDRLDLAIGRLETLAVHVEI